MSALEQCGSSPRSALTTRYPDEPATKDVHDRYRRLAAHALTN